jgi:putative endonuclease
MAFVNRRAQGGEVEQQVADMLEAAGWEILERNYNTPVGEIDIIARDAADAELVFVEVRSIAGDLGVTVYELLPEKKLHHLRKAVDYWFTEHHQDSSKVAWRVDFVGYTEGKFTHIKHL